MRANDFIKITAYGVKRNWKSLVAMTIAMACLMILTLAISLICYNYINNYYILQENKYVNNGAQLNVRCEDIAEFDNFLSVAKVGVDNGVYKLKDGRMQVDIAAKGMGIYTVNAILPLGDAQIEKDKIWLSLSDRLNLEKNLDKKLEIGQQISFEGYSFKSDEFKLNYAGVMAETSTSIYSLSNVIKELYKGQGVYLTFDYGSDIAYKTIKSELDGIVKNINKQIGAKASFSSISIDDNAQTVLLAAFVVVMLIIVAMVGISTIGSHIALQTAKDSYFFNILRVIGLSKGKLAIIEFIQMLAVLIVATIFASLMVLPLGGAIAKLSSQGAVLPFKYPIWICFACFGSFALILAHFAPRFAQKFDNKRILLGLREKE